MWRAAQILGISFRDILERSKIGSFDHPGGDLLALRKSLIKLRKLNPRVVCSGHGAAKWLIKW